MDDLLRGTRAHTGLRCRLSGANPRYPTSSDAWPATHPVTCSQRPSFDTTLLMGVQPATLRPWHILYFLPDPQGQGALRPVPANGSRRFSAALE